ncbi:RDD family protein [Mycolicibacterium gadium]|uniref:RDD family protein n=1 Tax=Mycolicibacterium gadium TaxID=1794 RepID=A0ABT6GJM2_MYCGU|nr:RDD family protein [Mycolicibacterium gadium]MDG5481301.1 RDD family protein [Mycolicibacterium gadium]
MTSSEPEVGRAAGIITRGSAAVIDLVVVLLIMGGLYGGLVLVRLVYSPTAFSLPSLNAVFSTVVTFAVAVVYLTGCWTVSGSTAGAVTMGLRVIGRRSPRVSLLVGVLRAICCVLFPIGLLWVVVDRRRRSLQDIVFRTRVIYSRAAR